ncbi:MAG: sodium/solute symporter [Oligosphaeraceae bacterium]|nr:sodium/solute symporter [Oligosphaeraceae bacterium]
MKISLSIPDYLVILVYSIGMLAAGWYFSKNKKDASDYLLGGRSMPWLPVGLSILMTFFSTYSMVMVPGEIYNHGLDLWVMALINPYVQIISVLIFTRFFFKINAFTPFEYLAYRYDKYTRLLAAVGNCIGSVLYVGMVLLSTAKIFEAAAGWPCWLSIILIGGVALIYTSSGGLRAVVWTDSVQFFVMAIGLTVLLFTLCSEVPGGAIGAVSYAFEHGHGLKRFSEPDFYSVWPYVRITFWVTLLNYVLGSLGFGTGQMTVQRLLATGSVRKAVKAQCASSLLTTPLQLVIWFIGLAIFSYYSQNPDPRVTSGDGALFVFVSTKLPFLIPGLFISAMLAASMSTLSSCFNSDAAVWLKEVYLPYFNKKADDRQQVRFSVRATIAVGLAGIIFSLLQYLSSIWFKQTMVEVNVIFGIITVSVGLMNYVFAIFSRKACSLSFWSMLLITWGMKMPILIWYAGSKRGEIQFQSSGVPGLAGPISAAWILWPALLAVLLLLLGLAIRKKYKYAFMAALPPAGFTLGAILWYIFSHTGDPTLPKVLSFQWVGLPNLIFSVIFMIAWHLFGPEQPPERYRGLIWSDLDSDVRKLEA